MTPDALPPKALAALHAGRKIEAIEHVRLATGMGLKEAKEWIDAYERGSVVLEGGPGPAFAIPARAVAAMKAGNLIEAARITRDAFLAAVAEAKAQAEQVRPAGPAAKTPPSTPRSPRASGQVKATPFRHAPGLGPGEIPRGSAGGTWIAVLLLGLAVIIAAILWR